MYLFNQCVWRNYSFYITEKCLINIFNEVAEKNNKQSLWNVLISGLKLHSFTLNRHCREDYHDLIWDLILEELGIELVLLQCHLLEKYNSFDYECNDGSTLHFQVNAVIFSFS